jgi:hypothetical protein
MPKIWISVTRRLLFATVLVAFSCAQNWNAHAQTDPLLSWNEGAAKKSITDFVAGSPGMAAPISSLCRSA